jgi:hypothetical protein
VVHVYSTWQENVGIFCDDPAICWKASQSKDFAKLRSENSEDALTWQFFRSIDAEGLVPAWAKQFLHIEDEFRLYYWQRLADQSSLDPDIDRCLATIEPYHTANDRQRTETDLILRGARNLAMVEVKLGYKGREITGWRQSPGSPIVPQYEVHARPLLVRPDEWRATLTRFAQPYKNLMLGRCLAAHWLEKDIGIDAVHLAVIVNGEAVERKANGEEWTYSDEFVEFTQTCSAPSGNLHFATWQDLRAWASEQRRSGLDFVKSRLSSHPLL